MLSPFGKLCRKLRIDSGELLKNMADKLQVTPAYLSAVEVGKRNVPKDWPQKISEAYSLGSKISKELQEAANKSKMNLKMELNKFEDSDKELVLAFARKFTELTNEDKRRIKSMLSKSNSDKE